MTKLNLSDAERQRRSDRMRQMRADPDIAAKRKAGHEAGGWKNEAASERNKALWQDGAYRERMEATLKAPETLRKAADARRAKIAANRAVGKPALLTTEEIRAAMRAGGRQTIVGNAQRMHGVDVAVPDWVPSRLVYEFVETAALYGEEHAARVIRAMKRAERGEGEGVHA
ncbi:hypothetical protein [Pleomorphomonas oryzae]|uniref:hypothetical protein n=1 Tax=Pleomorphomonas oryzae TaxID=261934 RepID=UPI000410610E|nr:hypothetical protein [Pleomorphomonas oryzae]